MVGPTVRAGAAAAALLAVLAGCSSAGPAPGRSGGSSVASPSRSATPSATSSASAPAPAPAPAPVAGTSVPPPVATASTPTGPSTTAAAPGAPPTAAPRSTCGSLMIRVIRGSAAPGYEFAALQFVNTGSTRCVLNGYPTVSLVLGGAPVGRVSAPESAASSSFPLGPGETAESRLKDFSSCQAPLSDTIKVVAPGSSITTSRPGQLRACRLTVSALTTPE